MQYSKECSTLSHIIRSDHIAVIYEATFDRTDYSQELRTVRSIKIAELGKSKKKLQMKTCKFCTSGRLEEDYSMFSELLHDVVIPKKTIKD